AYRHAGKVAGERVTPKSDDNTRSDDFDLAAEPTSAGVDLGRQGVAVVRGPTFDDVGDEDIGALEADAGEELLEELARGADEGPRLLVLVVAGGFANEHEVGVEGPFA